MSARAHVVALTRPLGTEPVAEQRFCLPPRIDFRRG